MLENYFPILVFILVGLAVGLGPILLGKIVSPNRPDEAKNSPYECGFEAFEDARMKFDVRYYLVAILFILFDPADAFRTLGVGLTIPQNKTIRERYLKNYRRLSTRHWQLS